ncbi:MAG: ornithine cyclodeaminase family protein [Zestosphaera sp.]
MSITVHFATLILSDREVFTLVTPREVVDVCERTWAEFALGRVINPAKLGLDLGDTGNWPNLSAFMNAMPAYIHRLDVAGLKWAGGFWNNWRTGLPSVSAIVLLIDPHNGVFKAIIEGSVITSLRTAAQTAIGIKHLARKNIETVGIYGAGTQTRYHIYVLSQVFPHLKFRIYDPREEAVQRTLDLLDRKFRVKATVDVAKRPEECASDVDVIVTLTTAQKPFLRPEWIKEGHLIAALGSYQELYDDVIRMTSKIVVDHKEQTLHRGCLAKLAERGEITEKNFYAAIGEITAGLKPGRESDKEIILFVPIGTGMLDVATGELAYRKAVESRVGTYMILLTDKELH